MKTLYVLVGPKGAGKTYLGTVIEKNLGIRFLRVEPVWIACREKSKLEGPDFLIETMKTVTAKIEEIFYQSNHVCIETTGASKIILDAILDLKHKYKIKLIAVTCDLNVCLDRVKKRDSQDHIPVSDDLVKEVNAIAANVKLDWDLSIDNSNALSEEKIIELFETLYA